MLPLLVVPLVAGHALLYYAVSHKVLSEKVLTHTKIPVLVLR
jgi:hypothetical protein